MSTLGKRIRDERTKQGLTVRGFARDIDVKAPFVTDIEADRRRPGPDVLARIAARLKIPMEELQALDPRITPEVKEWMDDEPRVSRLLRQLRDSPERERLLDEMEKVVRADDQDDGEG